MCIYYIYVFWFISISHLYGFTTLIIFFQHVRPADSISYDDTPLLPSSITAACITAPFAGVDSYDGPFIPLIWAILRNRKKVVRYCTLPWSFCRGIMEQFLALPRTMFPRIPIFSFTKTVYYLLSGCAATDCARMKFLVFNFFTQLIVVCTLQLYVTVKLKCSNMTASFIVRNGQILALINSSRRATSLKCLYYMFVTLFYCMYILCCPHSLLCGAMERSVPTASSDWFFLDSCRFQILTNIDVHHLGETSDTNPSLSLTVGVLSFDGTYQYCALYGYAPITQPSRWASFLISQFAGPLQPVSTYFSICHDPYLFGWDHRCVQTCNCVTYMLHYDGFCSIVYNQIMPLTPVLS